MLWKMLFMSATQRQIKSQSHVAKEIQDDQSFYPSDETLDHLEVYQQLGKKLLESITIFTFRSRCIGNNTKGTFGFLFELRNFP